MNPNEIPKMPSVTDVEKDPKPEKPKNNYRVMSAEDIKESKDWVKRTVPEWHDKVNPDVVLLTETSAVPFGWLLRNAWKEAYPNQKIPKFYRSDIGSETSYGTSRLWRQEDLIEGEIKNGYLKKRNINDSDIILVYDEASQKPSTAEQKSSWDHPQHIVVDGNLSIEDLYKKAQSHTLERNTEILFKAGMKNLWTAKGMPKNNGFYLRDYREKEEDDLEKKLYVKPTIKYHGVEFPKLTKDQFKYMNSAYTGALEKDPELRKRALDYIHDLKLAGKEAGIELHKVSENK